MSAVLLVLSLAAITAAPVVDKAPADNQKPYTPADGVEVTRNPPPFIWVPSSDDATYLLEVARKSDFSGDVQRIENIPVSTVALGDPLAAGEWYWRYGVVTGPDKVLFSKARRFTVPKDARPFPYPDIDKAIASVPQAHPRLFVLPSEVEAYRKRALDGDLKRAREKLTRSCDKIMGKTLVAEPDYVRGKGAARGKSYAEIFWATRPPMDRMESCGLAYLLTGEEKYGQEAKRRILHFFAWDPEGPTAYKNNDEPAMWVMMRGIRAYDWTYDLFTPEERTKVEAVMRIRAAQFYQHLRYRRKFHTNPYESHAGRTLGFLGEASLCFIHEWPEAREWLDYVTTLYWNVYPAWGKDDGGWHEGPGYWTAYMSFALHFVVPLKKATGIDLSQKPFFQNTPYYLLYTNPPYAKISPFGDGEDGASSSSKGNVMYAFSSVLQDPCVRWYAAAQQVSSPGGILGAVLKDDSLSGKSPADLPHGRYFPGVGLVSFHTALGNAKEDIHFLIHSDPYGPMSHAHADENAFTIEAFGESLAIASGYYPWYGSDHHTKWSWESKSSNTITFDGGIGQKIRSRKSKGAINACSMGEHFDYVEADATQAYQGRLTKCVRKVVHVRPGVFLMYDDLAAPKPVSFEWRLHSWSEMGLDEPNSTATVVQGDAGLFVHFLAPEKVTLTQTAGFGEYPPERKKYPEQYHLVASPPEKAEAARYLTVLIPYKTGMQDHFLRALPIPAENALAVRVDSGAGSCFVAFKTNPKAETVTAGPVTSDADVFAAWVDTKGKLTHTFTHGGSEVDLK